jgi:hypothetical protein
LLINVEVIILKSIQWPSVHCGNFDEFKLEGLHEKPSVATWNMEIITVLLKDRKIKKGQMKAFIFTSKKYNT